MYCPFCGSELPEQAKFCHNCGEKLPLSEENLSEQSDNLSLSSAQREESNVLEPAIDESIVQNEKKKKNLDERLRESYVSYLYASLLPSFVLDLWAIQLSIIMHLTRMMQKMHQPYHKQLNQQTLLFVLTH